MRLEAVHQPAHENRPERAADLVHRADAAASAIDAPDACCSSVGIQFVIR